MSKFTPLRNALADKGWSISSVELASDCWWAKEIWRLHSDWSPVGKVVHLVFLVDTLSTHDPNNMPESAVWTVGLFDTVPRDPSLGAFAEVPVKNNFQQNILKIVELAAAMRTTE